jgi:hypothetical protein
MGEWWNGRMVEWENGRMNDQLSCMRAGRIEAF